MDSSHERQCGHHYSCKPKKPRRRGIYIKAGQDKSIVPVSKRAVFLQDWNQTLTLFWIQCVSTCVSVLLRTAMFSGLKGEREQEMETKTQTQRECVGQCYNQSEVPQPAHNQEQKNRCQSSLKAKAVLQWRKDKRQASVTADLYLSVSGTTPDHVHLATSFVEQYVPCRLHKKSSSIGETNRLRPKIDFDASLSARKRTSDTENIII